MVAVPENLCSNRFKKNSVNHQMLRRLFSNIAKIALGLRYRIDFRGLDKISREKGVFFLPNHPSEMDPVILVSHLWGRFQPHAVATEDFYHAPVVHQIMKAIGVIPIPNMSKGSGVYKRLRVKKALDQVVEYLDKGENVLIHPSGRLMRSGLEDLRAATAIFDILQKKPNAHIVLVRTRGLLGSSFSWVSQCQRPDLWVTLKHGAVHIMLNLILFTPRRRVTVEFEEIPTDFPRYNDKLKLNQWIESWYNNPGAEVLSKVSYSLWGKHYWEFKEKLGTDNRLELDIPNQLRQQVYAELARVMNMNPDDIQGSFHLARDLGMDSLQIADLIPWLAITFYVVDVEVTDLETVHDVLQLSAGAVKEHIHEIATARAPSNWEESDRPALIAPDPEKSVVRNFLETADRMQNTVILGDPARGAMTFQKSKIAILLLADIVAELPEERVGIMLPASTGATLVVMATLLNGKVPVMINWTLGDANFEHVIKSSEVKTIITSSRFLDRLDNFSIGLIDPYLLILEDVAKEKITWPKKIRAAFRARQSADYLLKMYGSDQVGHEDPAVILYTSGSESTPKGVPLSHRNILSNIAASFTVVELKSTDVLYGFLPPFHSFGFTITTILPLVCGVKTTYYPNPTENRQLVHGIEAWKATIMCGTPTFVAGIYKAAKDSQLESLRVIIVGAEKAPDKLFKTIAEKSSAKLLEGYGITECSPVLTANSPNQPRAGVGKPVGDVHLKIVHPETELPVDTGERGLILATGSNIFKGYLDRTSQNVFRNIDGQQYYVTGDLGYLDTQGNLYISGRLKRFVKIGGEMVSLPAMEEDIESKYPNTDGEVYLAINYLETEGERPFIGLFTVLDISLDEVNKIFKETGRSNLERVHQVFKIDEIPLLGSGKTDYQKLTRLLYESVSETN